MKHRFLILILVGLCSPAWAQDDSLQAKIIHLLEVSGAEAQFISSAVSMIEMQQQNEAFAEIPASWWSTFVERVRTDGWNDIAPSLVEIYRANYTEAEIDYMIEYHTNPLTQSIGAKASAVQQESMLVGQAWGDKIAGQLADQLPAESEGN